MSLMRFEAAKQSAAAARAFVRAELADAGCDVEIAELLVSELATNAVGHGGSDFAVEVHVNGSVRVEVHDHDATLVAPLPAPDPEAEHGRGLFLVQTLSTQWGVELEPDGKTVWFEL